MSLFLPYKAVGYIADSTPFVINHLGDEDFLTVSIGRAIQIYRLPKLHVCLVSREIPEDENGKISNMAVRKHDTFVSVGSNIHVYNRTNIVRTYDNEHSSTIIGLNIINNLLVSYDQTNMIVVIDIKKRKSIRKFTINTQESRILSMCHPPSYVNKFIFGFANGELELWNINKMEKIYCFNSHIEYLRNASATLDDDILPGITCIEASPAEDVVAVGFSSGDILVIHLKLDKVLFGFHQEGGEVRSLSFRTDAQSDKYAYMVSASPNGSLFVWHLGGKHALKTTGKRRGLQIAMDDAHSLSVSKVCFLYGQPVMISVAADNTIKMWLFDSPDGTARLLRSREGHFGYPTRIRFYGGNTLYSLRNGITAHSCEVLSAGTDGTLRLFNTAVEAQNRELSQKSILRKLHYGPKQKLPNIIAFDYNEAKENSWASVVTAHRDHENVYLWNFRQRSIIDIVLRQPEWQSNPMKHKTDRINHATSVALSTCANFCFVGTRGGALLVYNVQSGQPRGRIPVDTRPQLKAGRVQQLMANPANVMRTKVDILSERRQDYIDAATEITKETFAHEGEITGVFADMMNEIVVTIGIDGMIKYWHFNHRTLLHSDNAQSPLRFMCGNRDNNLIAVAGQDRRTRVYDLITYRLVRCFAGHRRELTDMAFTMKGRRLLISSMDKTLRVWDMQNARCLSWLQFQSPITSIAPSLTEEYLVLTQMHKQGLYMYADRSFFEQVVFNSEPSEPTIVQDSMSRVDENNDNTEESDSVSDSDNDSENENESDESSVEEDENDDTTNDVIIQKIVSSYKPMKGEISFSRIPLSHWTSLFRLEALRDINKPIELEIDPDTGLDKEKSEPQAPFFLPTVYRDGATPSFPTPAEYQVIQASLGLEQTESDGGADREGINTPASGNSSSKKSSKKMRRSNGDEGHQVNDEDDDEAAVMADLTALSAWKDEDNGDDGFDGMDNWDGSGFDTTEDERVQELRQNQEQEEDASKSLPSLSPSGGSRILRGLSEMPRCRMVPYLLASDSIEDDDKDQDNTNEDSDETPLIKYLKTLMPSAVDVEMRSLCLSDDDEEGVELLERLIKWFEREFDRGDNFEILQAYLSRMLTLYSEIIMKVPRLKELVKCLRDSHRDRMSRFRSLVDNNIAVLKFLTGLPPY